MTAPVDPIVRQALKDLFKSTGHFSICKFDEICEVLNVIPPPGHRKRLRLLHCVSYRDMTQEVREEVGHLVLESLNSPGFELEIKRSSLALGQVKSITGEK